MVVIKETVIEGKTIQWPKEKRTKVQRTIYNTLHRKLKMSNMNSTKTLGRTRVIRKGKLFLLHIRHPSW